MRALRFAAAVLVCSLLFLFTSSAFADDGEWGDANNPIEFYDAGEGAAQDFEHIDADPWKGWAKWWCHNNYDEQYGDFHLKIKGFNISSVDFIDGGIYDPQVWVYRGGSWTEVPDLSWVIDNDTVGATMDIYFYDNPIQQYEKYWVKAYTDNTSQHCSSFTISVYPTEVPEPATIMLLGLGCCGLLRGRKRR